MAEQKPCLACGTKCRIVTSESGKYFYLQCPNPECKVMTMIPIDKQPANKKEGSA